MPSVLSVRAQGKRIDSQYIKTAIRLHHDEGTCEVDPETTPLPNSRVSRTGDPDEAGAYVLAWVWVPINSLSKETSA